MSKSNKIFSTVPVKIPDRSGFDLSHEVLATAHVGTVVPITHFEVLPGDTISMGSMMKVTLPPFAVPFMGRVDAELTAAFIPYRLLWQGWQSFITQNDGISSSGHTGSISAPEGSTGSIAGAASMTVPYSVPVVDMGANPTSLITSSNYSQMYDSNGTAFTSADAAINYFYGPGSLVDYLGYKRRSLNSAITDSTGGQLISALPFLAYHKFCDDWIRDENTMKPFFPKNYIPGSLRSGSVNSMNPRFAPFDMNAGAVNISDAASGVRGGFVLPVFNPVSGTYTTYYGDTGDTYPSIFPSITDTTIRLGSLRQRCWSKDYFTSATTRPQAGASSSVLFEVSATVGEDSVASGTTGFSIAQLRSANSLQKWLERNNIAGTEYGSQIFAHFGVTPPDAVLNRSVLLGSVRTPVVVSSVENNTGTGTTSSGSPVGTKSPFGNTLGAAAGFGSGFDKGSLVDNFSPKEHGVIMVFFTLIPHAYYNSGLKKSLHHKGIGDFAWPEFANIGDQPILPQEINAGATGITPFGYQQRYCEYKFELDRISGLLSDGNNLDVYALQRGFDSTPELGKSFQQIPTDYLDQVLGVSTGVGGFGCMVDAYFDCRALRVLPEYSLPSL